ncbi:MAG: hypothetical protein COB02_14335 [Candidatus Cloacimonadota bacterium]|nr:MAG: hypothetical protein COB02_14335 [Candidatus Cloacimonadota bacterium]
MSTSIKMNPNQKKNLLKVQTLLNEKEFGKAIKLATKIKDIKLKESYFLLAMAYKGQGRMDLTIDTLEEYIKDGEPDFFTYRILADTHRDMGNIDEALVAYEKLLTFEEVPKNPIQIAKATVLYQSARFEEALKELSEINVDDTKTNLLVKAMWAGCQNALEKYDSVKNTLLKEIDKIKDVAHEMEAGEVKLLAFKLNYELARSLQCLKSSESEVSKFLYPCLKLLDPTPNQALQLVREVKSVEKTDDSKLYHLSIKSCAPMQISPTQSKRCEYFREYEVYADSIDECMEFICEYEDDAIDGELGLGKSGIVDHFSGELKGVYFQSHRIMK